jgi:hypothetical protein
MSELEHLDKIDGVWCRVSSKEKSNKHEIFLNTIFQLTGKPWNSDDFEPVGVVESENVDWCNCICSKRIKTLCLLKQKSTGHIFRTGLICYKNKTSNKEEFNDKIKYIRAKRDGRVCEVCDKICQSRRCGKCRKTHPFPCLNEVKSPSSCKGWATYLWGKCKKCEN